MMRRCLQIALCAGFLLLPWSAPAQPPVAWWENPVASGLTLSDGQWERINQIVAEYRDLLTQERLEAEKAEHELESVVNAETVDWRRGRLAIDQLVKTRGAFAKDISVMTLRLRAQLTAEQWRTLQSRRGEGRGREGRGGGKGIRPDGRGPRPEPPAGSQPTPSPSR